MPLATSSVNSPKQYVKEIVQEVVTPRGEKFPDSFGRFFGIASLRHLPALAILTMGSIDSARSHQIVPILAKLPRRKNAENSSGNGGSPFRKGDIENEYSTSSSTGYEQTERVYRTIRH
jgi:hypothetical protein